MARTVKAEAQAVRRDVFVDVALRLIQVKGYEQMSIQDVLGELDASKGAFYHYFDSKRALLLAAVERIVEAALTSLQPVLDNRRLSALEKLEGVFNGIGNWKTERKELMLATIDVWVSDDNAIVREKVRRSTTTRLVPMLSAIVSQGVDEGLFTVSSPEDAARVILRLIFGFQEEAIELFLAREANNLAFEVMMRKMAANYEFIDRILGLPPGSFKGLDEATLRVWFG
jgi:AcrR family transcriptional regulator